MGITEAIEATAGAIVTIVIGLILGLNIIHSSAPEQW